MKSKRLLTSSILVGIGAAASHAAITGYTNQLYAQATQYYIPQGQNVNQSPHYYSNTQNGFGTNSDSGQFNFPLDGVEYTAVQASANLDSIGADYMKITGFLGGDAEAYASSLTNFYQTLCDAREILHVDLDAAATLTVIDPYFEFALGSTGGFGEFNLDGSWYLSPTDNTPQVFNLSAGSHNLFLISHEYAAAGSYFGSVYGTSSYSIDNTSYEIRLQTVPEPASMAVLGMGAIALIKRRRARA